MADTEREKYKKVAREIFHFSGDDGPTIEDVADALEKAALEARLFEASECNRIDMLLTEQDAKIWLREEIEGLHARLADLEY